MIDEETKQLAKEVGIDNIDESIKIGSKEEAEWKMILSQTQNSIKSAERTIELNKVLIPYIEGKIQAAREEFNCNAIRNEVIRLAE